MAKYFYVVVLLDFGDSAITKNIKMRPNLLEAPSEQNKAEIFDYGHAKSCVNIGVHQIINHCDRKSKMCIDQYRLQNHSIKTKANYTSTFNDIELITSQTSRWDKFSKTRVLQRAKKRIRNCRGQVQH